MDKKIDQSITSYLELIKKSYGNLETAYLFGSYVKGNFSDDSDIDIALNFKDLDNSKRFDLQVLLMILATQFDSRIEPHPISHQDFSSGNAFALKIRRTGIELLPTFR
jgi:predicted nucleotidyltransferase